MSDLNKPSLAKLLASIGLPGQTRAEQARLITCELAARTFAAAYLQSFNVRKAYQAIRPQAKASGRKTGERAAAMLANHRVQKLIAGTLGPQLRKAEIDANLLVEHISSDIHSHIAPFFKTNEVGEVTGLYIKPGEGAGNHTAEQLRWVRGVKVSKDGKILAIDLVDAQRAQALAMNLVELLRAIGQNSEGGTIPGELTKKLEQVGERRQSFMQNRLPPSRIPLLIEGQVKKL